MTAELELTSSGRILAGTRADITVRVLKDGVPTTPTGTLTYSVADATGAVVATGTPTTPSTGVLSLVLTAAQATVGTLTVTWGGLVFGSEPAVELETTVDVIGAWLFTLAEARESIPQNQFPDAKVIEGRDRVTERFEEVLGFALGRRYFRETLNGDGRGVLILRELKAKTLRAIETRSGSTWTALTSDELAYCQLEGNGLVTRESGYWPTGTQNIRVGYEAGLDPIPLDIKRAGLDYLKFALMDNNTQQQATAVNNEKGTFTLSKPGDLAYFTGLPSVDTVLALYRRKMPAIA